MLEIMTSKYEKELNEFLYQYNSQKEYFLAWIPENYSEIVSLDKDNFLLCIEEDKIVGCLGIYISQEQKVARLLGPIIIEDYFLKYIDTLYDHCLGNIPKDIKEIKIAFFTENILCKNWCDRLEFEQYNAEKTMLLQKDLYSAKEVTSLATIHKYEEKYKKGLELVHPQGVFFTLDELIQEISSNHHLLVAMENNDVIGYVYYEKTADNKCGEIILLHMREDKRGKGYGTLLIDRAIKNLLDENVEEILTNVRVDNYGAQKLYDRIGFREKETIYAYRKYLK
ncbi:MAG: hypothetical protein K0R21_1026 [Anaerocolumna sp.]|jgi:ribosomal protein S18 acetylase RimI-like enzyme|nr:hypothetical protein [Anaerocolumna sp.]